MSERMEKLHAIMEAEVTSYINIGRQQERERIVKLLESSLEYVPGEGICSEFDGVTVDDIINLIRNETK